MDTDSIKCTHCIYDVTHSHSADKIHVFYYNKRRNTFAFHRMQHAILGTWMKKKNKWHRWCICNKIHHIIIWLIWENWRKAREIAWTCENMRFDLFKRVATVHLTFGLFFFNFWSTNGFSGNSRHFEQFQAFRTIPGISNNSRHFGKF